MEVKLIEMLLDHRCIFLSGIIAKVLLTPFKHQVVPPPMAAQTLTLPCSVNQIAFSPSPCCDDMLVLSSDNTITLFKQNKSPCSMKHAEATGFRTITPPLSLVASSRLLA